VARIELSCCSSRARNSCFSLSACCRRFSDCAAAARALIALPNRTPSLRLLADQTARALIGIRRALDGLLLLADPARSIPVSGSTRLYVPDLLPSLLDAARVFVTIGAVELFWIVTEWPNGPQALVFAMIGVILFSQRADQAYATVMSFMVGVALSAVFAAIVEFAVLPNVTTFAGFSLAIGLVLVPGGALMAQPWQTVIFVAMTANFIPLLAPANQMSYDPQQFYNAALAIVAGVGVASRQLAGVDGFRCRGTGELLRQVVRRPGAAVTSN